MIITSTFMAIALVGTPIPASAASDAAASTVTTPAPSASTPQAAEKRYCIVETPTGSRMPRKTCKTRADWANAGVTIDK